MIQDIQRLLDDYHTWLESKIALRQIDQWMEITASYLDRHNYYLQKCVKQADGGFVLTDDGYTVDDLEQAGCELESRKRQDLLRMTLNGFGVRMDGNALQVYALPDDLALRKHNLVQAILAVNEMFHLTVSMMASLLYEGVASIEKIGDGLRVGEDAVAGQATEHADDFFLRPDDFVVPSSSPARTTSQKPRRSFGVVA